MTEINTLVTVIKNRENLSNKSLTEYTKNHFGGSLLSLRQLEPLIREIKRRFRILPRTLGVNGKRKTISGCTKFSDWCRAVLNRSDRTVRYMLAGGNTKRSKQSGNSFHLSQTQKEMLRYIAYKEGAKLSDLLNTVIGECIRQRG